LGKKYGRAWDITLEILLREFQSFDVLFERSPAKYIFKYILSIYSAAVEKMPKIGKNEDGLTNGYG
jgi:hypothetical protein